MEMVNTLTSLCKVDKLQFIDCNQELEGNPYTAKSLRMRISS